jgi:hypothetical protein|tara:strand:- start:1040 stop:1450 length:411 start_codon:yes stop_codon:yes gene_type:complete
MAKVVAQKQLCLKAFGNHFMEWMDWVCELFPKDLDMERARTALQQVKKYNPKGLISLWYKQIYSRYKKQIDDEDFAFFLVKDYSWDIEEGYAVNADKALKVIDRIRGQLNKLKDEEKKKQMKFIKTLSKLSLLYFT